MNTILLDTTPFFSSIDKYIGALFSDPSFSVLLAFISFWYSYYLFIKSKKDGEILALTRSSWNVDFPRRTFLVIYNACGKDLTESSFLQNRPLGLKAASSLKIYSIKIIYYNAKDGAITLTQQFPNCFTLDFDIFRKKDGVVIEIFHNSEKHVDSAWLDFEITGVLPDLRITRDDFTDHMMQRAESVFPLTWVTTFILGVIFTYFISIFIKPFTTQLIPYSYILIACLILSFFLCSNYLLARVGNNRYKLQGKLLATAFKGNTTPDQHHINNVRNIYFLSTVVFANSTEPKKYDSGFEAMLRFAGTEQRTICNNVIIGKGYADSGETLYVRSMIADVGFEYLLLKKELEFDIIISDNVIGRGIIADVRPKYVKRSLRNLFKKT